MYGTGPTLGNPTAIFGAGQAQVFSQDPEQLGVWIRRRGDCFSVYFQANWHGLPPARTARQLKRPYVLFSNNQSGNKRIIGFRNSTRLSPPTASSPIVP